MLIISKSDHEALRSHAESTYPHECCGVLIGGVDESGTKRVRAVVRCANARTDSPQNRYEIDPRELLMIQRECRAGGHDIIGFYHSHPDHPAQWSQTDLQDAHWTGCSYVITRVEHGRAAETNSFCLAGDPADECTKQFVREEITII